MEGKRGITGKCEKTGKCGKAGSSEMNCRRQFQLNNAANSIKMEAREIDFSGFDWPTFLFEMSLD